MIFLSLDRSGALVFQHHRYFDLLPSPLHEVANSPCQETGRPDGHLSLVRRSVSDPDLLCDPGDRLRLVIRRSDGPVRRSRIRRLPHQHHSHHQLHPGKKTQLATKGSEELAFPASVDEVTSAFG